MNKTILFLLFLLVTSAADAQKTNEWEFTLEVPEKVIVGEHFMVRFILQNPNGQDLKINWDKMQNAVVLYGPATSMSTSTTIINGEQIVRGSITFSFQLQATKTGKIIIPEAAVRVGEKIIQTKAKTITATVNKQGKSKVEIEKPSPSKKKKEKLQQTTITDADCFIKTSATNTSLGLNNSGFVTYKLYSRFPLVGLTDVVYPQFNNLSTELIHSLKQADDYETEEIKGKKFFVYTLFVFRISSAEAGSFVSTPLYCLVGLDSRKEKERNDSPMRFNWATVPQKTLTSQSLTFNIGVSM